MYNFELIHHNVHVIMAKIILILLVSLFSVVLSSPLAKPTCGKRANVFPQPLIVGGKNASEGEFPWQVSVQGKKNLTNTYHICGGSILSSNTILTASHCVQGW